MDPIEVPVIEGLLCFDGRVVELLRNDGRQGAWRLHAGLITAVEEDRRSDRIEVRFHTTPTFYESAHVPHASESAVADLVARVERARG